MRILQQFDHMIQEDRMYLFHEYENLYVNIFCVMKKEKNCQSSFPYCNYENKSIFLAMNMF